MNMVAAIMTEPDFAEVMFLVAFILFVIEVILCIARLVGCTAVSSSRSVSLPSPSASWPCSHVSGCDPRPRRLPAVAARRRSRRPRHRLPRAATVTHSRRTRAAVITAILAVCLGTPAAAIAFVDWPSSCRTRQDGPRWAGAYCSFMDGNDGYRVRGKRNTFQGVSNFWGSWAVANDYDGSSVTLPSGQSIVSGTLWVEKADCCFRML